MRTGESTPNFCQSASSKKTKFSVRWRNASLGTRISRSWRWNSGGLCAVIDCGLFLPRGVIFDGVRTLETDRFRKRSACSRVVGCALFTVCIAQTAGRIRGRRVVMKNVERGPIWREGEASNSFGMSGQRRARECPGGCRPIRGRRLEAQAVLSFGICLKGSLSGRNRSTRLSPTRTLVQPCERRPTEMTNRFRERVARLQRLMVEQSVGLFVHWNDRTERSFDRSIGFLAMT